MCYVRTILLIFSMSMSFHYSLAQNNTFWSDLSSQEMQSLQQMSLEIKSYEIKRLDFELLKRFMIDQKSTSNQRIIGIPMPDGTVEQFVVEPNGVLPPSLVSKYPGIRTFWGKGLNRPALKIFMDFTVLGFHAMVKGEGKTLFVDPVSEGNIDYYISYYKKDFVRENDDRWKCESNHSAEFNEDSVLDFLNDKDGRTLKAALVTKEYETAIAVTGEYTALFGGTVVGGLSAVTTAINRVSGVYYTELGVILTLVPNNDLIIYTDPNSDPFQNNSGDLNRVQSAIDGAIGFSNYDVGHVFTSSNGGVASLGVVCSGSKARGLTGLPNPTGDPFYIDYVAHEIGHQFAATHTFNGDSGSCSGGNRTGSTAYEPGSGSTIMAYAGICGNDNLQNNSDAYFHLASLMQMTNHINGSASSCPTAINNGNDMPTADANFENIDGKRIPASTPFELIGNGSDVNEDDLTFQWDEWDLGPQVDVNAADNGSSPLFRSWFSSTKKSRIFPRIDDLVNGTTTIGEQLPTADRTMNFQFIVRDNVGGWVNDLISLDVVAAAGPFMVTSQNSPQDISGSITITWDVAGTDGNGINCSEVDISMSIDGGITFTTLLADNTVNDGSENITLPLTFSENVRIKVKCSDNVFFDINDADLSLAPESVPCNVTSEINDDPIADGMYSSSSSLEASGTVPNNGAVVFTSVDQIILNPDFEVESGAVFEMWIYPCDE